MLTTLRVSGFALIEEAELELGPGMTAITGETGAGKSLLLEALALLRGGRANAELIRAGRDEARVEAVFELAAGSRVAARLAEQGVDVSDGLLARRVIARNGRGRASLGGSLATATELAATVGKLVDITSQHEQQSLMDPDSQLAILDAFAGNVERLARMRAAYEELALAEADLAAFDADARHRQEREDFLRFQLAELEQAALAPGEDEALRAERERTRGAERFAAACARGEEALYAGDGAAAARIAAVARELAALAALDPALAPLVARLQAAQAEVVDVAGELSRYGETVRFDPERLAAVEERLHLIGRLLRKHGGGVGEVLARQQAMQVELAALGNFEEGLAARRKQVAAARAAADVLAGELREHRRQAAARLGRRIDETLHELGMAAACVRVELAARGAIGPKGADQARFSFSANPGEEARPLAKVASGGELSRVMLAVKRALAHADQAGTYVFDEVDAGVGGGAAEIIGRKLRAIAQDRQVIVVTHLPQIAACADRQVRVTKQVSQGRTTVAIQALAAAEREAELARMLGGAAPSPEAVAHAREMLRRAWAAEPAAAEPATRGGRRRQAR